MTPIHCNTCGASNSGDADTCLQCGSRLIHPLERESMHGSSSPLPRDPPAVGLAERTQNDGFKASAVSGGQYLAIGCLSILIPFVGPLICFLPALLIWRSKKRAGSDGLFVIPALVLILDFFFLQVIKLMSVVAIAAVSQYAAESGYTSVHHYNNVPKGTASYTVFRAANEMWSRGENSDTDDAVTIFAANLIFAELNIADGVNP